MKDRNENRPGYKKTKVGWIPKKWDVQPLGNISDVVRGASPRPAGDSRFFNGNYLPWVTVADITKDTTPYLKSTKKMLTKEGATHTRIFSPKTLLLTNSGATLGVPKILEIEAGANDGIAGFLKLNLDIRYAYYLLLERTQYFRERLAPGVGQPNLNTEIIGSVLIPISSLPEQKKIAEILSTWDEAIEQTRKLINSKKRRKKALMQQLLTGKKRLRGFVTSKGRKSYRFFDLPEDWECPQIRDLAQERSERNAGRDDLTVLSCSKHLGFVESSEYFGKQVFSADTSNYKVISRNYFGYPSNHIEEGSIGLLLSHDIGIVSPIYTVFKCNEDVIPEYLYAVFKTDTFRHIFAISTNASVDRRGSLRWREFSLIRVPLPSKKEQQAIVDVLSVAENEIVQIEKKLKAYKNQQHGLMQKLLTGEVRVTV